MRKHLYFISSLLIMAGLAFGQETKNDYIIQLGNHKVGGYVNLGGRAASVQSENAAFIDAKIGVVFNHKWTVGLTGSVLSHGEERSALVDDGTYHLYASYGGLFVERIFSFTDDFKLSCMLMTGQGQAYYQYDKDYRQEKVWTEETIDKTTFAVQELGIEVQHRIYNNFWLGVNGTFRNTSPVQLISTSPGFLKKPSVGISLKYGIL